MKKKNLLYASFSFLLFTASVSTEAQRKLNQQDFIPVTNRPVTFTPFQKTDFAPASAKDDAIITLPNKKKVKLSDYIKTLNKIEGNLSAIGFARDRQQKTVLASRYKLAGTATIAPANVSNVSNASISSTAVKPQNALLTARFVKTDMSMIKATDLSNKLNPGNADRINSLPNEAFNRTIDLTPPEFRSGDYGVKLVGQYFLKGETDPFVYSSTDLNEVALTRLMKETTSFFTAGLNITASSTLPALGGLTAYKLETEFTARSNKAQKHSSKAKLQIMQQVLLNEVNNAIAGDNHSVNQNRIYQANKLIGAADIFTYGINLLIPVDFYLSAGGIGANIEVDIKRTGISGAIGPRVTQSIILETSATELVGPIGEGFGNTVDVGVGGELRLLEGGFDFGFSAGLIPNNRRLVFVNTMFGEVDVRLLRGRLFTFYQYPVYKCDNILSAADLACWETRRVENDLFNIGAAIKFEKKVVDEDKSVYVSW